MTNLTLRCGMGLQLSMLVAALCSVALEARGNPPPLLETRAQLEQRAESDIEQARASVGERRGSLEMVREPMTQSASASRPRALSGPAPDSKRIGGGGSIDARTNRDAKSRVWLTVTLTGLATSAAVIAGTSWWMRERHAERWNSSRCLASDRPREDVCGAELNAGEAAERVAVGSAIVSGLLFAGAAVSFIVDRGTNEDRSSVALTRCSAQWTSVGCSGTF